MQFTCRFYNEVRKIQLLRDPRWCWQDWLIGTNKANGVHNCVIYKPTYQYAHTNGLSLHKHLLADSAYPNLSWIVTLFRDNGNLSPQQRQFNFKHSSTRIVREHAFGLLKGRFRRLRYFENKNISFIVKCVIAACVLHNICINFDDLEDIEEDNEEVTEEWEDEADYFGQDTRLQIFNELFHN